MAAKTTNKSLVFTKIPTTLPEHGEHMRFEDRPICFSPPPAGVTVKTLLVGIDPFMRDRMRAPGWEGYVPPFVIGETMTNFGVAKVVRTNNENFQDGDIVTGILPIAEYSHIPAETMATILFKRIENPHKLDLKCFLGPLGLAGMTAWVSFYGLISQQAQGGSLWVNAASSAVGQIVGQLAKKEGMQVFGSVGSQEKLDFVVNEIGFDGGFNYREEPPLDALRRLAPEWLDIVYDNVGGGHFQAALEHLRWHGKLFICGCISDLNTPPNERFHVTNLGDIFRKRLTVQGFIWWDDELLPHLSRFNETMSQWLADGSIKFRDTVYQGIDRVPEAFTDMFNGSAFGKVVVEIARE
ncbi:hypothetical protein BGZ63DRAFT_424458 [Mariannaea sp. PMI_226]|nr:hypothetical protein BGZ63DRAFT_424458 [Mariannaea sp. PMI_226]